ncbi:uncharacterized protein LOC121178234 [Toxotes jaculatrix]|uniref:uncharacterized protein LOC121178234 n=1 Tax=Toxotes jaculatrix TaxID=941984 RepID=UPI001B3AA213|nr:uncharacterized protein LOC121178234 [Toxotes jaculatrix]
MSDRYFETLKNSRHEEQLPSTSLADSKEDPKEPQHNMEAGTRDEDNNGQKRTFDSTTPKAKTEAMLKGMAGYQLTPDELDFVKKRKEVKFYKKLQLPSAEKLTELSQVVLKKTTPSTKLPDRDTKSLLAMVMKENIRGAIDEMNIELTRMQKMSANSTTKEHKERGQLEKHIVTKQLKIQAFMNQLSELKSELAQQLEAYRALQMQLKTQEEIRVEAEDTSESLQSAKSQEKLQVKKKKKVTFVENFLDSKSTRNKHTDSKTDSEASVKDDDANKNTTETLKTSRTKISNQKSEAPTEKLTNSVKAARGTVKKVKEEDSHSQEPLQAVKGIRKPLGTAQITDSQLKNQTKAKTGEAGSTSQQATVSRSRRKAAAAPGDARDEAQNISLRRSTRLASRK